jgi:hypothetical protein
VPVAVSRVMSVRRMAAIPKSISLIAPWSVTSTLSGLRSRWTAGMAWAWDSTVAIWAPMAAAQATGSGAAGSMNARSGVPATSSITR